MSKILVYSDGVIAYPCPGCGEFHGLNIPGHKDRWTWNGDKDKPTFSPSVHRVQTLEDGSKKTICHHYVEDGKIRFLDDCPHSLRGQTVEMEDYYKDE